METALLPKFDNFDLKNEPSFAHKRMFNETEAPQSNSSAI